MSGAWLFRPNARPAPEGALSVASVGSTVSAPQHETLWNAEWSRTARHSTAPHGSAWRGTHTNTGRFPLTGSVCSARWHNTRRCSPSARSCGAVDCGSSQQAAGAGAAGWANHFAAACADLGLSPRRAGAPAGRWHADYGWKSKPACGDGSAAQL